MSKQQVGVVRQEVSFHLWLGLFGRRQKRSCFISYHHQNHRVHHHYYIDIISFFVTNVTNITVIVIISSGSASLTDAENDPVI